MSDSRALESAYERSLQEFENVLRDEKARQLRLQMLLLRDENDDLSAQLATDDEHLEELVAYCKNIETQLEITGDGLQTAQSNMRIKMREIETLKAR